MAQRGYTLRLASLGTLLGWGGEQDRVSEYPSRCQPLQGSGVCTRTPCESHLGGSSPTALLWPGCGGPEAALSEVFAAAPLFSLLESQAG